MTEFNLTIKEIYSVVDKYRAEEELSKYIDVRDLTPKQIAEFVGFKIDKYAVENAYDDFLAFNNSNNADKLTEI